MKSFVTRFASLLAASLLLPFAAHGQAFRAYVASYGNDANPCTVTAPCRLLPAAITAVASGGEVWMLDSANFNSSTVTITKNVSILAVPGQIGSIVGVAGGPAISVTSLSLRLRNVAIVNNAANPGTDGIAVAGSANVFIEDSLVVAASSSYGINMSGGTVVAQNVTFRDSKGGIRVAGNSSADVSKSRFSNNNYYGVYVDGTPGSALSTAAVTDCDFTGGYGGVLAWTNTGSNVTVKANVSRSSFSNLLYGVAVVNGTGTTISSLGSVTQSSFSSIQFTALDAESGGILETLGDNQARQVGTPASGTTSVPHV